MPKATRNPSTEKSNIHVPAQRNIVVRLCFVQKPMQRRTQSRRTKKCDIRVPIPSVRKCLQRSVMSRCTSREYTQLKDLNHVSFPVLLQKTTIVLSVSIRQRRQNDMPGPHTRWIELPAPTQAARYLFYDIRSREAREVSAQGRAISVPNSSMYEGLYRQILHRGTCEKGA